MHGLVRVQFLLLQLGYICLAEGFGIPSSSLEAVQNVGHKAPYYMQREPLVQQHTDVNITETISSINKQAMQHPAFTYQASVPQDISSTTLISNGAERDESPSQKNNEPSVVTSVSILSNGDELLFKDFLGKMVPKPSPSFQVSSPIDLLHPDRYEFYTFDNNGQLIKRLMTMQEIQSIVANGDGETPNIIHPAPFDERDPEKNVQDIVYSVKSVLNKQKENAKNMSTEFMPVLDTPDVSSTWSIILPAIFGNTGGDFYTQQKPQQIVMTSDVFHTSTLRTLGVIKKPKPSKRKPGQKHKTRTTSTTEITPQVVQEELEPHESVYAGLQQYQNIAANVQDFEELSNIHLQPIYHKLPPTTTKRTYVNNQAAIVKKPIEQNVNSAPKVEMDKIVFKKPNVSQNKHTTPHRKTGNHRPRPTLNQHEGQKKPDAGAPAENHTIRNKKKPTKTHQPTITTATISSTTKSTETIADNTEFAQMTNTANVNETSTTKEKDNKPTLRPLQAQKYKLKPSLTTTNFIENKPAIETLGQGIEFQKIMDETQHRPRPKPYEGTISTTISPLSITETALIIDSYTKIRGALSSTEATRITTTSSSPLAYISPGYPIPSYGTKHTEAEEVLGEVTINQLEIQKPPLPPLSFEDNKKEEQQKPILQTDIEFGESQAADDLNFSIGQIVQTLKQDTSATGIFSNTEDAPKPKGYDSVESADKLNEIANKRKSQYVTQASETPVNAQNFTQLNLQTFRVTTEATSQHRNTENTTVTLQASTIETQPLLTDSHELMVNPVVETIASVSNTEELGGEPTTTDFFELANPTTVPEESASDASIFNMNSFPITLSKQVSHFLENNYKRGNTTVLPTDNAILQSDLDMMVMHPTVAVSMGNFQNQAATVASHLIDGLKSSSSETKLDIEQLMTDAVQQVKEQNANVQTEQKRFTNFADLNSAFLLKAVTSYGDTLDNSTGMFADTTKLTDFTTTILPIDGYVSLQQNYLPNDIRQQNPVTFTLEPEKTIPQNTENHDFSISMQERYTLNPCSNRNNLSVATEPTEYAEAELTTTLRNIEDDASQNSIHRMKVTLKASGENKTAIVASAENIENKVNDTDILKEAKKHQQNNQEVYNPAGAAQLKKQHEFRTEASNKHEKQSTNGVNPINSASQLTITANNNTLQDAMSLNESSAEQPLGTANTNKSPSYFEEDITQTTLFPRIGTTFEPNELSESSLGYTTYSPEESTLYMDDSYVRLEETTSKLFSNFTSQDNYTVMEFGLAATTNGIITDEEDEEDQGEKTSSTSVYTILFTTTTNTSKSPDATTVPNKRLYTLKPVSYYKQPSVSINNQAKFPKPITYVSPQQRPIHRPATLSNLMVSSTQATRPPVRLEPSPNHSKGLEASTLSLDPDVLAFTRLCNELAFNYWKYITSENISSARSLVVSPFALTSMLSMVFLGARGSTSGEMNDVLKLDDMVTFNPHLIFKNITDSVEKATDSNIATSAFVREILSDRANGRMLQFFKEKTQQFYAGHVEEVNFHVVNDLIRRRTNLLVKRHTMGKVKEYLRTNSVWVNGPLATISANLFQTDCSSGSISDRDGELLFQVHPQVRQRRLVPIPAVLFRSGFTAGFNSQLDATIVAFGRIEETVSTIYVMPGHQFLATGVENLERLEEELLAHAFNENAWSNFLTSLMDRPGLEVQLPRFSHRSFVNASLGLQKMGLKSLFSSEFADLRGLTGSPNRDVFLSDMIQINTFSTCGEESIADQHHVEMYPAPPLRKRNKNVGSTDADLLDSSEAIIDFGSLVQESALARNFYDDLLDPKYLELPLPLRPRQARVPDAQPRLRFDRPFLYFVRHNPTGMLLFMGRFNPRLLP